MPQDKKETESWNSGLMFCSLESTAETEKKVQKAAIHLQCSGDPMILGELVLWYRTGRSDSILLCRVTLKQ